MLARWQRGSADHSCMAEGVLQIIVDVFPVATRSWCLTELVVTKFPAKNVATCS